MKQVIIICVVVAIILSIIAIGYFVALDVEKIEVTAKVTNLEYKKAISQLIPYHNPSTKTTIVRTQQTPAKYLVTITYEDISVTVNDKYLYNSVQEGDTIQMIYCRYYNKDHVLTMEKLKLPKK